MPVSTDNLYNIRRLNVWFALSAVLLTIATLWMIWVDYNRPWKAHQNRWMDSQATLAHLQYLTTQQEVFQNKVRQAQTAVDQTKAQVDPAQNKQYAELLDQLNQLQVEYYGQDMTFKEQDAWIVVTRSEYEKSLAVKGPNNPETTKILAKLESDTQTLAQTRQKKEELEDQQKSIRNQLKAIEADYATAQRQLTELQKIAQDAKIKRDQYSDRLRKTVFNWPLLDFAAPKNTPGRHEIRQVVAGDVKAKLNFLDGYKIDRCTTCHVVIEDKNYSQQNLVAQFEAAIPAIQEELSRSTSLKTPVSISLPDPPKIFGLSLETLKGNVAQHWNQLTKTQQNEYFDRLHETINAYLAAVDMPTIDLHQPLLAHPDLDLFLSTDSPHPLSKMGCTVCHEGNGQETDFILAAHTPKTHAEEKRWTEKYYDRNLGVPRMTWSTLEHFWDFPMIPPKYSQASCAKCHDQVNDIARYETKPYADQLKKGQELFTQTGCINCHKVENIQDSRMVGTDLTHVGSKLNDGFLHNWIFNPRDFRPASWMPHFFNQENSGLGSENKFDPDPILRTKTEVQAITHYLKAVSTPFEPKTIPADLKGNASAGQQLFAAVGCLACHGNIAEFGPRWIKDDLLHAAKRNNPTRQDIAALQAQADQLSAQINHIKKESESDPRAADLEIELKAIQEKISARQKALQEEEAKFQADAEKQLAGMNLNAQIQYAVQHFTEEQHQQAKESAAQEELLATLESRSPDPLLLYVPPIFTRFAPDLSGIGSKVGKEWLYSWLIDPQHYASYTKMPSLRLSPQEAMDLAEYLVTLKHPDFDQTPFELSNQNLAQLDILMEELLSGQNSAATVAKYKSDQDQILTRRLMADLSADSNTSRRQAKAARIEPIINAMDLNQKKLLFLGQKMITHYGCYACHKIAGFEEAVRPGTELTVWGEKNIHQLDFAFFGSAYHHTLGQSEEFKTLYPAHRSDLIGWSVSGNPEIDVAHSHASFATHKLLNPRIWDRQKQKKPYEKLKMPNFYFNEEETEQLVTYLLSRRPPRVADSLKIHYDKTLFGPIAAGRKLAQELNCVGCHKIENNVATLHQFITTASAAGSDEEEDEFEDEEEEESVKEPAAAASSVSLPKLGDRYGGPFDTVNGPPWLRGQGAKVQPGWFHQFLLNVETLRPWATLKVRMPSFYLSDQDAQVLVDYFAALAKDESDEMKKMLTPINQTIMTAENPQPARREWHQVDAHQKVAQLLSRYGVENELLKARDLDLSKKTPDQVGELYEKLLDKGNFFTHLYDIKYPFEKTGYRPLTPEQFQLGQELFQELKCLSCHVLGDPKVPGSNPAPTAPNLALTYKRLRYEWFLQWLQEPNSIQPGTKMPQWFPGGQSAFSEAQGYSAEMRGPLEEKYSADGRQQMRLLMDFVWQAGMTNLTATDPSRLPPLTANAAALPPPAQAAPAPIDSPPTATNNNKNASNTALAEKNSATLSYTIDGRVTNQASIGPRSAMSLGAVQDGGTIAGQVRWVGSEIPSEHWPVAEAMQAVCGDHQPTKPLNRLQMNPDNQGVKNAVVYLAGQVKQIAPPARSHQPTTIFIEHCDFDQPVMFAPRGSVIRFESRDPLAHTIRGRMDGILLWSKTLASTGASADFSLDKLGIIQTRSASGLDWMDHFIWVVDHAGYALTDQNGKFTLTDIPAGEYTLHLWHPGLRTVTSDGTGEESGPMINFEAPIVLGGLITVQSNKTTQITFELK